MRRVFKALQIASYVWAAITLPAWFLNSIAELKLSLHLWQSLIENLGPGLRVALSAVVDFIAPFVEAWRAVVAPLREFVALHLPIRLPHQFVEFAVAIFPLIPALLRSTVLRHVHGAEWKRSEISDENSDLSKRRANAWRRLARHEISSGEYARQTSDYDAEVERVWQLARSRFIAGRVLRIVLALVLIVLVLDVVDFFWA